jgi:hypothetical protein
MVYIDLLEIVILESKIEYFIQQHRSVDDLHFNVIGLLVSGGM